MATYAETGIHLDDARRTTERLEEIVARGRGAGVLADVGAFGGMFRLGAAGEFADPVLVASTDGIGTKVKIAAALGRYGSLGMDIWPCTVPTPRWLPPSSQVSRTRAPRPTARCWAARRLRCRTSTRPASSIWPGSWSV